MSGARCIVCRRQARGKMCKLCHRSYRAFAFSSGAIIDVVEWAANRARRFAKAGQP